MKPIDEKSIERRKNHWAKCEYGAPGGLGEMPLHSSIYCCTNINIGQRWHLEKWQEYVKVERPSYEEHVSIDNQAYSRFGTTDVYVLNPKANLIECEECPEYKPKKI